MDNESKSSELGIIKVTDLFSHLNSLSGVYHANWNIYTVVVLGILAYVASSSGDVQINELIGFFLIVTLAIFLITNFMRICIIKQEINAVEKEIKRIFLLKKDDSDEDFIKYYSSKDLSRTNAWWKGFHILVDVCLIYSIFFRVYCQPG